MAGSCMGARKRAFADVGCTFHLGPAAAPLPLLLALLLVALLAGACGSAPTACRVTASTCHTAHSRSLVCKRRQAHVEPGKKCLDYSHVLQ